MKKRLTIVAVAAMLVLTATAVLAFEVVVNTSDIDDGMNVTYIGLYLEDRIFDIWIENDGIPDNGLEIIYAGLYPEDKMIEILIENQGHENQEAEITLYTQSGYSNRIVSDNCSVVVSPRRCEDISLEYIGTPDELTVTVESPPGSGNFSRIMWCTKPCSLIESDWLLCP